MSTKPDSLRASISEPSGSLRKFYTALACHSALGFSVSLGLFFALVGDWRQAVASLAWSAYFGLLSALAFKDKATRQLLSLLILGVLAALALVVTLVPRGFLLVGNLFLFAEVLLLLALPKRRYMALILAMLAGLAAALWARWREQDLSGGIQAAELWTMAFLSGLNLLFVGWTIASLKRGYQAQREMAREERAKAQERIEQINRHKARLEKQALKLLVAQDRILRQSQEIEAINKQRDESIAYAKNLQRTLMPKFSDFRAHFSNSFVLYRPKDVLSGDFVWVQDTGPSVVFGLGDCTGHGVRGAFMSVLAMNFLDEAISKRLAKAAPGQGDDQPLFAWLEPSAMLEDMRHRIKKALQNGDEASAQDGLDMALCVFDKASLRLKFAGANLSLAVVRRQFLREPDFTWIEPNPSKWQPKHFQYGETAYYEVPGEKVPVGLYFNDRPFRTWQMRLRPSDILYLASDGYKDQFGGREDRRFGHGRFRRMLLENAHLSLPEQYDMLKKSLAGWIGSSQEQIDDITVLALKIDAKPLGQASEATAQP